MAYKVTNTIWSSVSPSLPDLKRGMVIRIDIYDCLLVLAFNSNGNLGKSMNAACINHNFNTGYVGELLDSRLREITHVWANLADYLKDNPDVLEKAARWV